MKKFCLIIVLVLTLLLLISCSKKETDIPDGMAVLNGDAVEFNFYYPEDWQIDRNDGMVSVYVSDKDRSNVSVTTFTAPAEVQGVDGYLTMGNTTYFDHVKATFPDLEMLTDGEEVTLGGAPARQYVFTASVSGDPYKFRQVITYYYGYIHILTYTSTIDGFDSHTDEVNKIISEFTFK